MSASVDFTLLSAPVLSRNAAFRDEPLRLDVDGQRRGWPTARLVVVDAQGRTPVTWLGTPTAPGPWDVPRGANGTGPVTGPSSGSATASSTASSTVSSTVSSTGEWARLRTRPSSGDAPPSDAVLLGEADGVAYWAVRGDPAAADDAAGWTDLRAAGAALDALDAGLFTTAAAVLNWHDQARFCTRDGTPMTSRNAGWHRHCENGHEEYPRTDPAVICLVHDGGDRVVLARQPSWPEGRFSVLAGFVEAGESLEACVLREIHEEVGADVSDVRYLGSQSWPFPRSLMIGFHAVADPALPLVPADGEIAEAMWVTRAEVRDALGRGDWAAATPLALPGRVSIARSMLESWAALG